MFGQNIIVKPSKEPTDSYNVREIFSTMQGEGPLSGTPATFVRLNGCNLRCHFCDTDFDAVSIPMSASEILGHCNDMGNKLIVITGGEPFVQRIEPLIDLLLIRHDVQVETAGTVPFMVGTGWGLDKLRIVVSPKTGSLHPSIVHYADAYKYLIKVGETHPDDGLPVTNTQDKDGKMIILARPPSGFPKERVFLQPLDESHIDPSLTKANQAEAARLAMKHGYRLSLQLHKLLGLP